MHAAHASFCQWLDTACATVAQHEQEGKAALERGDTPGYIAQMRSKADFLSCLAQNAVPLLGAFPDRDVAIRLSHALSRFSRSAGQALDLDSVFYMSALLFPEDHREGQPNDLECFAEQCRKELA